MSRGYSKRFQSGGRVVWADRDLTALMRVPEAELLLAAGSEGLIRPARQVTAPEAT